MKILVINPLDYRYGTTYRTRDDSFFCVKLGFLINMLNLIMKEKKQILFLICQPDTIKGYVLASFRRFQICLFRKYDMLFLQNFTPLTFLFSRGKIKIAKNNR